MTARDQDFIPDGFIRADEALRELLETMNSAEGCDEISGLPAHWDVANASDESRRSEWAVRVARAKKAERMIWGAIAGMQPTLTIWTRSSATTHDLSRVETSLVAAAVPHQSLSCGRLMFANYHRPEQGWPLFIRKEDWMKKRSSWLTAIRGSSSRAEQECGRWLSDPSIGEPHWRKTQYRAAAHNRFPGLSGRAFDRAWGSSGPEQKKRAGRPKKSQQ